MKNAMTRKKASTSQPLGTKRLRRTEIEIGSSKRIRRSVPERGGDWHRVVRPAGEKTRTSRERLAAKQSTAEAVHLRARRRIRRLSPSYRDGSSNSPNAPPPDPDEDCRRSR